MSVLQTEVSVRVRYHVPYWVGGGGEAKREAGLVVASAEDGGFPFSVHEFAIDDVCPELQGSFSTLRDAVGWCVGEYRQRHPGRVITLVRELGGVPSEVIYGLDDFRGFAPAEAVQLELPFPPLGLENQQ